MISPDMGVLTGTMVRRFAAYWEGLRQGDSLPARSALDPGDFVYCLPNVMVMDLSYEPLRVRYRLVGSAVVASAKLDFTGRYLDEITFPNADFDWMNLYRRLVAERRPLYGSIPIESAVGERKYDLGLFPLSSEGRIIDKAIAVEDYEPVGNSEVQAKLRSTHFKQS
ncbi:MAG: hypothetical protein QOK29_36 [Rhodospirillaceae bacterium]|jgi:hypothetical protein|nr:hypothetical protein [Rhodospirillaceae bacterium]